jgi:hypothetical protein
VAPPAAGSTSSAAPTSWRTSTGRSGSHGPRSGACSTAIAANLPGIAPEAVDHEAAARPAGGEDLRVLGRMLRGDGVDHVERERDVGRAGRVVPRAADPRDGAGL